jgi:threo-3-hydroxy-L-aspartate ammonia-lyase
MPQNTLVTLEQIQSAQARIAPIINKIPLLPVRGLPIDANVWLKPESLQPIGSFKIRGAYNAIASLPDNVRKRGVIAYSSGNHAQGVAFAARHLGISAVIVMPKNAPAVKIEATRAYGAEVVLYDPMTQSREEIAEHIQKERGLSLIPPFNHVDTIAGQGTIGLEIVAALPEVDLVLTPVGGGGLISGVATAIKALRPDANIIGVEPALADDARQSLHSGHIVTLPAEQVYRSQADGVRTLHIGDITFEHMRAYVKDVVTVSEEEITAAGRRLLLEERLVVEPSGALPLAAVMFHAAELPPAKNIVLVLSGGSMDASIIRGWLG